MQCKLKVEPKDDAARADRVGKFFKLLSIVALCGAPLSAQTPVGPNNRPEAIQIGGIDQVVSIRSQALRNPVIIYFHGGP
jgi:hypothetical protein